MSFNVPEGWKLGLIGDVIELKYGKNLTKETRDGGIYNVYGSNGVIGSHSKFLINTACLIVGRKGSIGEIHFSNLPCWPIDTTYYIDKFYNQPIQFWWFFLKFLNLNKLNRASAVPGLNRDDVYRLPILLPPLNEQKRIVTKIEALEQRSNRAQTELEAIKPLLDKFRQSVLSAAFRGDLTQDWREKNFDVEPVEVLLEKIKIERRRQWEETEFEKLKTKGVIPKDDKWKDKYKEPEPIDNEGLSELPDGWCWSYLDIICKKITDGEHLTPPLANEGVYLLSAKDVRNGYLDFSNTKFVSFEIAEKSRNRCNPEINDILVVSRGATVGRSCLITTKKIFCLMGSVLLFKLQKKYIFPKIIDLFFKSPLGAKKLASISGASAQQAIYIRDMRSLIVPIPSFKEQQEIVRRIENLFKLADNIEQQYKKATNQLETLNQSILAKAFRGELVPQNPNDEPASVLLERIKAEKAKQEQPKRTTKKTSKKQSQQLKLFE